MTAVDKSSQLPVTHRTVLAIAVPVVLSNLTTPLLGLADTAVMGQLGGPKYIGAIAVGALIFNFLFWAFGFLRMGTTGFTAQAYGADDGNEVRAALGRALVLAVVAGIGLIALQWPLERIAFWLIDGSADVEILAGDYYAIRIWSAPAALINFALLGWFIGLQRARTALILQLILNGINVGLDIFFVMGLGWGVTGVALGTAIAEVTAAACGLALAAMSLHSIAGHWSRTALLDWPRLARTITVNRDIMARTLLLMFAFAFFTAQGAAAGNVALAANAVLMQFVFFAAFFLDGFAFAAEALVGQALGAKARRTFDQAVKLSSLWSGGFAVLLSLGFVVLGPWFIDFLTIDLTVRAAARDYLWWAASLPVVSFACYQLDGIFIGATRTADMRDAAALSLIMFLLVWWALLPFGNHGLWAALTIFNAVRAIFLGRYYPALVRSVSA